KIRNAELHEHSLGIPFYAPLVFFPKYYNAFDEYSRSGNSAVLAQMIREYECAELERYISIIEAAPASAEAEGAEKEADE
ncbi:MAG: hypothetical protein ACI4RG_08825, partial [Huintestinicola sp.]